MVKIPPDALSPEILDALIEEFVSRDGTDLVEAGTKIAQVRQQLQSGAIVIVYDEASESANIVPKDYRAPVVQEEDMSPRVVYEEETPPDPTE
jgi:uncharacterized protein YheU (UPF0270 family)